MSELKEVFAAYKKLSFTDRIVFYTTLSNTVNVHEDNIQDFLIETRICDGNTCIFCEGSQHQCIPQFIEKLYRQVSRSIDQTSGALHHLE